MSRILTQWSLRTEGNQGLHSPLWIKPASNHFLTLLKGTLRSKSLVKKFSFSSCQCIWLGFKGGNYLSCFISVWWIHCSSWLIMFFFTLYHPFPSYILLSQRYLLMPKLTSCSENINLDTRWLSYGHCLIKNKLSQHYLICFQNKKSYNGKTLFISKDDQSLNMAQGISMGRDPGQAPAHTALLLCSLSSLSPLTSATARYLCLLSLPQLHKKAMLLSFPFFFFSSCLPCFSSFHLPLQREFFSSPCIGLWQAVTSASLVPVTCLLSLKIYIL